MDLPKLWIQCVKKIIDKARLPVAKLESMTQLQVHPELRKPTKGYPQGVLNKIVTLLPEKVILFLTVYQDFDVVASVMSESSGQ